jgi:ankyrin repeat protein
VRQTADFGYVVFDHVNSTNALGDNALHCVCVWGDIDSARVLIEAGMYLFTAPRHR